VTAAVKVGSARITAEPYPFDVPSWARTALVVIDMQRDFLEEGGFGAALGNDVSRLRVIVPTLERLLAAWRAAGLTIVHTQEGHAPDLSDCPRAKRLRGKPGLRIGDEGPMGRILVLGEPGNDFVSALKPQAGEIVLPKPGKGAFCATGFDELLKKREITHLVITGVTTEVCVQTTMREANDRGYECLLVEDATESYFPEFKAATLAMVRAQGGIVGFTAPTSAVLGALEAN
jgi:nicotinamidase-related amidase